ncbi:MAG: response regulator [Candidatus Delongbacteria bacterium]|nr:response regulator [Candidatus Delongbacteria bacterium]MBN2833590.1 response regulator [Candidatus Delongbacteria bacterium]
MIKMLVAEDDLTSRIMICTNLKKWGYNIVEAKDGNEAETFLKTDKDINFAVLDWMMPGKDGPELIKLIKDEISKDKPFYVILLTSKKESEDVIFGLNAGADDFIEKPYDMNELKARISVGERILDLTRRVEERERLNGVLEMAGAVSHEFNQPLQVLLLQCEFLLNNRSKFDEDLVKRIVSIEDSVVKIGELTRKLMNITTYRVKKYVNDKNIIDIMGSGD